MAKQKKKKKKQTAPMEQKSFGAVKAQLKAFNWRRALLIALSTLIAFALFETLIELRVLPVNGVPVIYYVYYIITILLVGAVVFLNRGFSVKEVTPDMFADDGDPERVRIACENVNKQKKLARKLMLVLLPFVFAIFFDMIYLFYGDFFKGAIDALFGGNG